MGGLRPPIQNSSYAWKNCYSLDNGQWKANINNLKTGRSRHAASNIGNNIMFSGGYNGSQRLSSTEIMHHDGKITSGPNLPQGRSGHCQVSYGHTTFIIGKCIVVAKENFEYKITLGAIH